MNSLSYLQNIYWREPLWLLLVFQPVIIILLKKIIKKNNISLYAEKKLQPWLVFPTRYTLTKQIFSKNSAYLFAWLLFSLALAGPRIPLSQVDKEKLFGVNIMLVVDLSQSMKAMDILPNRLRRAEIEIYDFLDRAQQHRVGITVFSARPHLLTPLTSDHLALKTYLKSLANLSFPTRGSDPVAAILFAQKELLKTKGKSAIILITDGDFVSVNNRQIDKLKQANVPLYILGVGTPEGEAVQEKDGSWLKYNQRPVISRMNVNNLRQLSNQLKGKYSPVYDDDTDWKILYAQGISRLNTLTKIDDKQRIIWNELFSYFLFPSLFLFWFSLSAYRLKYYKNFTQLTLVSIFILAVPENDANAIEIGQTTEQAAYRAYFKGNYAKAEKLYKNIVGNRAYYGYLGQADSLYKMGHYQKAIRQYTVAILNAQDDRQRAKALYNLANSYFRTGSFSSAINAYQDVLRYQPGNKACLYNINISQVIKKNIERRLKEKEKIIALSRQGRGPRSASIADGTEINENTAISIGGNDNILKEEIPLPKLPDISDDIVKKLILSGLKNIEFAKQGSVSLQQLKYENSKTYDLIKAQHQLNAISSSQHLLWKRLFEMEEGFPAPVATPRILPGVEPW
jgi:Ca-activated chloride channel family protein